MFRISGFYINKAPNYWHIQYYVNERASPKNDALKNKAECLLHCNTL